MRCEAGEHDTLGAPARCGHTLESPTVPECPRRPDPGWPGRRRARSGLDDRPGPPRTVPDPRRHRPRHVRRAASTAPTRPGAQPNPAAKAKAVIQIWMWGGPSHLDTFDPKPEAGSDYSGPLDKPIATNVDGVRICELMPLLAK